MALIRILEKDGRFRKLESGEPTIDTLCGSGAGHFKVSPDGRLSFYKDDTLSRDRLAFGFAMGRRAVDEVEFCALPQSLVEEIVTLEATPGGTPLADVNGEHVDAIEVTLSRLCGLTLLAAKEGQPGSYSATNVVEEFVEQVSSGCLQESDVNKKLLDSIRLTRAYRRAMQRKSGVA